MGTDRMTSRRLQSTSTASLVPFTESIHPIRANFMAGAHPLQTRKQQQAFLQVSVIWSFGNISDSQSCYRLHPLSGYPSFSHSIPRLSLKHSNSPLYLLSLSRDYSAVCFVVYVHAHTDIFNIYYMLHLVRHLEASTSYAYSIQSIDYLTKGNVVLFFSSLECVLDAVTCVSNHLPKHLLIYIYE